MLLYIHVPFCRQKCAYCAFYSVPLLEGHQGAEVIKAYLAALSGELRFWSRRLGKTELETVFFGGGTPSLLPARVIEEILDQVRARFSLSDTAEISIEANPESALAKGWLFDVRKAGVNRLSLGVQSFSDICLSLLGRCHDSHGAEAAFHTARSAGFSNISLDFMWGLPGLGRGQSQREWLEELHKGVELHPEHISTYGLTLEPDSKLEAACSEGRLVLPDETVLGAMYVDGGEYLEESGYLQYEISNFARTGYECRHNLGYWQGRDYLGLGPAATSTIKGRRWTNPADITAWQSAVKREHLGEDAEELGKDVLLKERLMLGLRMSKGLDVKEWHRLSGRSFLKDQADIVEALQDNSLAEIRQGHFRLTRAGMLVSDSIIARFFEKMEKAGN